MMTRRLIEAKYDSSKKDKRDHYANKRFKCASWYLELLFEDKFKLFNSVIRKLLEKEIPKLKGSSVYQIAEFIGYRIPHNKDIITKAFINAISTGNFVIKRFHVDTIGIT